MAPGEFSWTGGDCRLYLNPLEQVDTPLAREPLPLSVLRLARSVHDRFAFRYEHIALPDYRHHAAIRAPRTPDFTCKPEIR